MQQPVAEFGVESKRPQAVAKVASRQVPSVLPQLVTEVPWGHHRFLLDKVTEPAARLYYLRATAQFGWSRNVLLNQIKAGAYERAVIEKKTNNFPLALPEHLAEQAEEVMKSSYSLEFLGIILCAEKDDVEVEYALRSKANPIGVAAYQLQSKLPVALKGKLPTAKQLSDVVRTVLPARLV